MTSCQRIVQIVEKLAPKDLALDWDNPGLNIGDFSQKIEKILLTLTVTQEVAEYAAARGHDMIISHHPVFFKPLKSLRWDLPEGKIAYTAAKNDIAIYSAHTNLDIAVGGVNDVLAQKLSLKDVKPLKITKTEKLVKLVVFVPEGYDDIVRNAIGNVGAGFIGNYSCCTFNSTGIGTFKPEEGTKPFIGKKGNLEKVKEVRIETIVPEKILKKVVNVMIKAHPYEEVAYDIYPLKNEGEAMGIGRIGYLQEEMTLLKLSEFVKKRLSANHVRVVGNLVTSINKVALCGGAGADLVSAAAFKGADVLVTGDFKYHEALEAKDLGLCIIDAGHFPTEYVVLSKLADFIKQELALTKETIKIEIYEDKDPFVCI